ncbi:MAG: type II CRISPR RNA-guided endonuclease Cas9 [Nitrospirota bacterium]|nr:type II CRISPR RNA-guided endonuclease Cas9 [Nitrospirota bacterium]
MQYVLGLDLGPNSIGWAMVEHEGDQPTGLIDAGVRVFPEGVDRKPTGSEESKNTGRRMARALRRTHDRRRRRKQLLKGLLTGATLLPPDGLHATLLATSPYALRARGLSEKLTHHELGRALYHLAQRRGFKSNLKTDSDEDSGTVKPAISQLEADIAAAGCKTLGQYLNTLDPHQQRIRGRHTGRDMYEREFDALWNAQQAHHPDLLTEPLRLRIHHAIFDQRPLKIQRHLVGVCTLEERIGNRKKRAHKGTWQAQQFRMLETLARVKVTDTQGAERRLSEDERAALIDHLSIRKEMTWDAARKKLSLSEGSRFNLELGGLKKLPGNTTAAALKTALGAKEYAALSERERDDLIHDLLFVEDPEVRDRHLTERFGFDAETVARLKKVRLQRTGRLHLSQRAVSRLMPHLIAGKRYDEAVSEAGYDAGGEEGGGIHTLLPEPPELRNPIVQRALHEVRKVVNGLVRAHGKPAKIRVEMARDLKSSARQREEMRIRQRGNEKANAIARDELIAAGIPEPSRSQVIKYRLWEECNHQCPYTGKYIASIQALLFSGDWDIEHILPADRSLDDSIANKTLCYAEENRKHKRDKTPWEAYGDQPETYAQILSRVRKFRWPGNKKLHKFTARELKADEFIARQLVDTRYIATEVKDFMAALVGKERVEVGRGQLTAAIRRMWGLNGLLGDTAEKNRADHRHHAVDAVVTALTTRGAMMAASRLNQGFRPQRGAEKHFKDEPWPNFRNDVDAQLRGMVISHRVLRRARGALHEETNYGVLQRTDSKGVPLYAVRKPVAALTAKELERIGDPAIRKLVANHLRAHGVVDPKKQADAFRKALAHPLFMPTRDGRQIPVKRVRIHKPSSGMISLGGHRRTPYRAVEPGGNHHMVIFEFTDAKGNRKRDAEVVSMFEAARRARQGEPVIRRDQGPGRRFVMSLSTNEMVQVAGEKGVEYYRVQYIDGSNKVICLRRHTAANLENNADRLLPRPNTLKGIKVMVDPLGRVTPAGD